MAHPNTQAYYRYPGPHHLEFRINGDAFTQDISEVTFDLTDLVLRIPDSLKIRLRCGLVYLELRDCGRVWNDPSILDLANSLEFHSALRTNLTPSPVHATCLTKRSLERPGLQRRDRVSPHTTTSSQEVYCSFENATTVHTTQTNTKGTTKGNTDGEAGTVPSQESAKLNRKIAKSSKKMDKDPPQAVWEHLTPVVPVSLTPEGHPFSYTEPTCGSFSPSGSYASSTSWSPFYQPGWPSSSPDVGRSPIPVDVTSALQFNRPSSFSIAPSLPGTARQNLKRGREEDAPEPASGKRQRKNVSTTSKKSNTHLPAS